MPENIYLRTRREEYAGLQKSIQGLQQRASEAKRDLTNEEKRSVAEMGAKGETIFNEIESLSQLELRDAKVASMAGQVAAALRSGRPGGQPDGGDDDQVDDESDDVANGRQVRIGGAKTRDRDPGFYTRSSKHSFVGDQYRSAKLGDREAHNRLEKHSNALRDDEHLRSTLGTGGGAGLVPPVWLAEQFAPILHRRLRLASVLRQVPWSGPYPWSIPIAGTPDTTAVVAEGTNPTPVDPTYTILTVTPQTFSGYTEVSRQMLEAANPAIDAVIWGDLNGDFYDKVEIATVSAFEAQASVNATTIADGAVQPAARNGLLDAITQVSDNSGGDADILAGRTARWTYFLKITDTTNRPLVTSQMYPSFNGIGKGDNTQGFRSPLQGNLEGLDFVTSPSIAANRVFVINSQEHLISISPPMQFSFEQPVGPALVRVGVWGYAAIVTGRRPKAISKVTYTAG